jgi:hypothetical protein
MRPLAPALALSSAVVARMVISIQQNVGSSNEGCARWTIEP